MCTFETRFGIQYHITTPEAETFACIWRVAPYLTLQPGLQQVNIWLYGFFWRKHLPACQKPLKSYLPFDFVCLSCFALFILCCRTAGANHNLQMYLYNIDPSRDVALMNKVGCALERCVYRAIFLCTWVALTKDMDNIRRCLNAVKDWEWRVLPAFSLLFLGWLIL